MNSNDSVNGSMGNCICDRPKVPIICINCDYFLKRGRVCKVCHIHTRVQYISDLTSCPQCRKPATGGQSLLEIRICGEIELNYEIYKNQESFAEKKNSIEPPIIIIKGPTPVRNTNSNCICSRAVTKVFCPKCGFVAAGRIRKICPDHPMLIKKTDFTYCPGCSKDASVQGELEEVPSNY